jgi:hypothetical protein
MGDGRFFIAMFMSVVSYGKKEPEVVVTSMRKLIVLLLLSIWLEGCHAEFMDQEPGRLPVIPTHDHGHSFTYKGKVYMGQAVLGVPSS